jgi:hypothetical protein
MEAPGDGCHGVDGLDGKEAASAPGRPAVAETGEEADDGEFGDWTGARHAAADAPLDALLSDVDGSGVAWVAASS